MKASEKTFVSVNVREGVAAFLDGKFYGCQIDDYPIKDFSFGPIENAEICDPRFCKRPEDMTHKGSMIRPVLEKAKLVKIRRCVLTEIIGESQ